MLVMSALKDALSDSNPKTRMQAVDYFAAAFGDAAQMCPAKTAPLLALFAEHLVTYKGEDAAKHAKLLLAFLEDVPGLWLSYSATDLLQVFSTGKLVILSAKLVQLLYRIDPSVRWWALWTLPRFARMKLVEMFDWDSDKGYRPYFDLLIARLYMFPDSRSLLPASAFPRLLEAALAGNVYIADYLKRGSVGGDLGWGRRAILQFRAFVEGGNIEAAIALCKLLSLLPTSPDFPSVLLDLAGSVKDFRLLKELVGLLKGRECAGTVLSLYQKGMEQLTQSLAHFDYFLAACIATLKEIVVDLTGVTAVLAHPHAKSLILRLGCDLLETQDLRSAYFLSNFALYPAGRRLLSDCKILPALIKHLSAAAEGRDEGRTRDLLPVVQAVAWNEALLLEDPERSGLEELLAMRSHTCNWESEETGKSVFRVIEGEWMARELVKDAFSPWNIVDEGLKTDDISLRTLAQGLVPSIDTCPLSIYLRSLTPSPFQAIKGRESRPLLSLEVLSQAQVALEVRNFLQTEGISPYSILARWREYRYLSVLPGGLALSLSRSEDSVFREGVESRLLGDLMQTALETGRTVAELAASRFLSDYGPYQSYFSASH